MVGSLPCLGGAEEAALLASVRQGGEPRRAAFAVVYRNLREPILALGLHLTGRLTDAEDVLQETFLLVYRALPGFRGEARLSTWVFQIALRVGLQLRGRRRNHAEVDPETPAPRDTEAALIARDEAARLRAAVADLPAEHRAVLALFAVEGLGHRAIAEVLGVPEGTVWSRLHTARRRLGEVMGRR
ncbi:MAG TPA: sigma-70 family RNA polymerase sigma factor [Anaeromyxobacteraceae bacterium]|nr:sigma-70 family RNA polymerase sigma factor [Anaeromyxobacteraceae bacterium]